MVVFLIKSTTQIITKAFTNKVNKTKYQKNKEGISAMHKQTKKAGLACVYLLMHL